MGQDLIPPDGIEPIDLRSALEERYLSYALSTITHRALPDVRDGSSRSIVACSTPCAS